MDQDNGRWSREAWAQGSDASAPGDMALSLVILLVALVLVLVLAAVGPGNLAQLMGGM